MGKVEKRGLASQSNGAGKDMGMGDMRVALVCWGHQHHAANT